jgi:hypothetical protein
MRGAIARPAHMRPLTQRCSSRSRSRVGARQTCWGAAGARGALGRGQEARVLPQPAYVRPSGVGWRDSPLTLVLIRSPQGAVAWLGGAGGGPRSPASARLAGCPGPSQWRLGRAHENVPGIPANDIFRACHGVRRRSAL